MIVQCVVHVSTCAVGALQNKAGRVPSQILLLPRKQVRQECNAWLRTKRLGEIGELEATYGP